MRIRHKFNAVRVEYDNIKFPSKKECLRYKQLKELQKSKEVAFFLRQVPFHLEGGVKYISDFVVFWSDGNVTIEDVKGMKTPIYIMKKKLVEASYPIKITEI